MSEDFIWLIATATAAVFISGRVHDYLTHRYLIAHMLTRSPVKLGSEEVVLVPRVTYELMVSTSNLHYALAGVVNGDSADEVLRKMAALQARNLRA
jgi:hypothetical protein